MALRICITGASGFIGGRLLEFLSNCADVTIHALVRTASDEMLKRFPTVLFHEFELVHGDYHQLKATIGEIDCLIHLASINEHQSQASPVKAVEVNTLASIKLLAFAKSIMVKRIIYFSTLHVYGAPLVGELSEQSPCMPSHPYSITHKTVEDFLIIANKNKEFESFILRLSNSYGAPIFPSVNRWTLLINSLARSIFEKGYMNIKSANNTMRNFISLNNVCRAVYFLISKPYDFSDGGIINVGEDSESSIYDMALILQNVCQSKLGMSPTILVPDHFNKEIAHHFHYNCTKLIKLGFELENDMETELERLLLFCQQHFSTMVC